MTRIVSVLRHWRLGLSVLWNLVHLLTDLFLLRFILKTESERKPREVFLDVCGRIAEPFEERGFKFVKSRACMYRNVGSIRQEVGFGSSRYNQRGALVWLDVNLSTYDLPPTGGSAKDRKLFSSVSLGNLCKPPIELYWNLAFVRRQKRIVETVVKLLEDRGLPHMEELPRAGHNTAVEPTG